MAIPSKFTRGRPAGNSRGKNNTPWVLRSEGRSRFRFQTGRTDLQQVKAMPSETISEKKF